MARSPDEEGRGSSGEEQGSSGDSGLSIADAIHEICKRNARASLNDNYQLRLYLESWWSTTYNRPLKDPLLLSYTDEELLYEFYDKVERAKAKTERAEAAGDKIEEAKLQDSLDWAEEEEKRDLEKYRRLQEEKAAKAKEAEEAAKNPAEDPDNKAWEEEILKQEIEKGKKLYGEDFGEDLSIGSDDNGG